MTVTSASARKPRRAVPVCCHEFRRWHPPADLPRVFERFYRVEKSRDSSRGGAGIGLAIVRQLVEADGGEVGVESDAGATRFWFSLPS